MPQLDFVCFYNQVFWLLLFFILSYVVFSKNVLPFISQVLKTRYMVNQSYTIHSGHYFNESQDVLDSSDKVVLSNCNRLSSLMEFRVLGIDSYITNLIKVFGSSKDVSLFVKVFVGVSCKRYSL